MITKVGKLIVSGRKLPLLPTLPFAAVAAWRLPEYFDASIHYVDPMDNTYCREPGIIYDSLKRNTYVIHS